MKLALRRFLRAFFIYGGLLAFFAVFGKASVETKIVAVVLCGLGIAAAATLLAWFFDQGAPPDNQDGPRA